MSTEHTWKDCEGTYDNDSFIEFFIEYGWILRRSDDHQMNDRFYFISHCPYCGKHLEIPHTPDNSAIYTAEI